MKITNVKRQNNVTKKQNKTKQQDHVCMCIQISLGNVTSFKNQGDIYQLYRRANPFTKNIQPLDKCALLFFRSALYLEPRDSSNAFLWRVEILDVSYFAQQPKEFLNLELKS